MSQQNLSETVGTLNLDYRKREGEEIELENMALAKRLLEKKPAFNISKMEEDYEKHMRYKSQVMKMNQTRFKIFIIL
jgi:hypothetical protein